MGRCGLQANFCRAGDAGVLALDGDLDIATASVLAAALVDAVAAVPEVRLIVVDLDGVLFCGARGLEAILDAAESAARRGGRLVLARRPSVVSRLMQLLDVDARPHPLLRPPLPADRAAVEILPRIPGPSPALR